MGQLSYRGAWFAGLLAAFCAMATACAEDSGGNAREASQKRQVVQFDERLEAKRRDSQARCDNGDQKACSDAVCMRLFTEGPSAERYRDCSRSQGFKTTSQWAQFSEMRTSNHTRLSIQIVCLTDPEVIKLGGEEVKMFHQFELEANADRPTGFHDRNRFYTNPLGGPDFATWQEAADELCNPRNRAK
jgi:hypothetical protein